MGYAGGSTESPTYHDLADHTEVAEVVFDPTRLSFEEILETFWSSHRATSPAYGPQYRSVIFYQDESQRVVAETVKARLEAQRGVTLYTAIEPAVPFWQAEDYHQKYFLRREAVVLQELTTYYPSVDELIRSTVAARANGIMDGFGDRELFEAESHLYGLSDTALDRLWRRME